jgi:RimJ/RimL family protein N-acetyltransferase
LTNDVRLRDVTDGDLAVFFENQRDPEASRMVGFEPRDQPAFDAHWTKIRGDAATTIKTIVVGGQVAGDILSFERAGRREVGYWLGHAYWGKGIATRALSAFLDSDQEWPLYGVVAKHNVASRRVLEKCGFTICAEEEGTGAGGEAITLVVLTFSRAPRSSSEPSARARPPRKHR